ncbi:MAG: nucleoside-diphosphate kinase [Bacteroidota bacterium]|nr:hypothetical protein [Kiloniellaceae bacterium]
MSQSHACRLTPKDQHLLHALLAQGGKDDSFTLQLREKLAAATIVPEHAMPPDVVTLYSRVRYRIGDQPPATRILIHDPAHAIVGATLPVSNPCGLALLGVAAGATTTLAGPDGAVESISVEEILYQPEAASAAPHWALR